MTYTARDRAGNVASIRRVVMVSDACTASGERRCPNTLKCSTLSLCDSALTAVLNFFSNSFGDVAASNSGSSDGGGSDDGTDSSGGGSGGSGSSGSSGTRSTSAQRSRKLLPDTMPPRLSLRGSGTLFVTPGGASGMIHSLYVDEPWVDEGVDAEDDVDESFDGKTNKVVALPATAIVTSVIAPSGAKADAIKTDTPTGDQESGGLPWVITYDVSDGAGNRAPTMRRRVYVLCRPPERECPRTDPYEPRTCRWGRVAQARTRN